MKKTILVAAVMFLGLTAAAFAQATFSVGSIPVTTVTSTGYTEKSGDVTFTQISGTSIAGTITIQYGVPITVPFASVTVTGSNGYPAVMVINAASSNAAGSLVIDVPAGVAFAPATPGNIVVSGVRVAVAGTGLTSLTASISSTGNALVAGQTNVTVISAIAAGLANLDVVTEGSINAVTGAPTVQPVVEVDEGYLSAFYALEPTTTTGIMVRFTLDQAPPAGVTVTFPGTVVIGAVTWETADSSGVVSAANVAFTSSSTSLVVYYRISDASVVNPTAIETLTVPVTLTSPGTATLPLPAATVSISASLAPVGTAFTSGGAVITSPIPRFLASDLGPQTLFTIVGSQTTLLIPFASTVTAGGYNTGFSIANTTADPGTTAMGGLTTAVDQTGKLKFYMYPQLPAGGSAVPTTLTYETSATSPGTGLDASGNLPAGSTYTVLLSQLLAAAGAPADFQGYIIVVANFTNAHCLYVLSDFAGFTQGAQALVIEGARNVTVEALDN